MTSRAQMWERLGEQVDVLVIGGGITGAGIARDAAARGLSVAVVDMGDIASGTSSKSSKLVHGGLRYLESYEFSLVFESVSERRILLDLAPHLVDPLAFLFPVYEGARRNIWMINAGMWLYDGLSLFRSPKKHQRLKPDQVADIEPILNRKGLTGAPLYYDCSTDDARLTIENMLSAVNDGATVVPWCKVDALMKDEQGRVSGAVVRDVHSGELKEVAAHAVVNATGPWTDDTLAMSEPRRSATLRPTKGIHVVVDFDKLPVNHAVVCFHPTDKRVLFALPWGDRTYIGTTDTDYSGDPADVAATLEDVDYLLRASNWYFPAHQLVRDDVICTWAGLRPLIAPDVQNEDVAESRVSREHQITVGQDGMISIAGGKLTTYRKMGEEVVDTAVRLLRLTGKLPSDLTPSNSDNAPLPGAIGWPEDDDHDKVAALVLDKAKGAFGPDVARHLGDTYGMRALDIAELCDKHRGLAARIIEGRPEIMAQVKWAIDEELASELSDVMIRRMQLYYRDSDQGLGVADKVADFMAKEIGWSAEQRQASVEAYRADVARSRRWRQEIA